MLIDWFTVAAQAINFLILIFLLKTFLYRPILNAVRERERRTEETVRKAREAQAEAEEKAREMEREREQLALDKERMYAEAREEVNDWKEDSLARVEQETLDHREKLFGALQAERDDLARKLRRDVSGMVFSIAGKALTDLADASLVERMIEVFLQKVEDEFAGAEKGFETVEVLHGAFADAAQSERLRQGVQQALPGVVTVTVAGDDSLGFGFRLTAAGEKFEWSLAAYMRGLEDETQRILSDIGLMKSE